MKRFLSLLMAVLLMIPLAGCGKDNLLAGAGDPNSKPSGNSSPEKVIGICVPNDTDQRWLEETAALSSLLEKEGLTTVVEYAQDDVSLQASQIQALIARPVGCLVIAAIDSLALTDVLQQAKQAGIPVIAYDRLLMQTDAVTYYIGYDHQAMGVAIADHIVKAKQLETAQTEGRSHTIEFFMGSPEDNNAVALYTGIAQVLQPYLDCGVLVCPTGRTAFEDVCIQDWSGELTKARCQSYLSAYYTDAPPEILCAASDAIADGCRTAVEETAYDPQTGWPLITGQGGQISALRALASGRQSMTVYKDLAVLPQQCFNAVKAALGLAPADIGDTGCHNGTQLVPAFFSDFIPVDTQNYREALINSGIFSEEQLATDTL